jgi:hypothetical protein
MFVLAVVGGGGGGVVWVPGHDYPALAWPRRGHLPGGSTTKRAATRVVVGGNETTWHISCSKPHVKCHVIYSPI